MPKSVSFRFHHCSYVFTFKIGFFLFCLFFFSVFCVLGFWQLHRYDEKTNLLKLYQQRLNAAPQKLISLENKKITTLQFQTVEVEGHYLNQLTLLIQNQFYQGETGFEVLTPLKITGEKKLLLVDRGWITRSSNQSNLESGSDIQKIRGYIKLVDEHQFILGKNILDTKVKPWMMQKIDLEEISRLTHQSYYPFILRLNPTCSNGFVRDWIISTSPPERHLGYAVQWWIMAIVLMICYLSFCCKKIKSNSHDEK